MIAKHGKSLFIVDEIVGVTAYSKAFQKENRAFIENWPYQRDDLKLPSEGYI